MPDDKESIYGAGAITGNPDDATKILEGRDVDIKMSETKKVNLKTESTADTGEPKDGDHPDDTDPAANTDDGDPGEGADPEKKLEGDVKKAVEADKEIQKDLNSRGIDFNALATEYESNGTLSAESFEKLEKAGYPKAAVETYIAGMQATADRFVSTVEGYAGGKEEFARLSEFVASQGKETVDTFNRMLATGDLAQIKLAVNGFVADMNQKYGTAKRSIMGDGNNANTAKGYTNKTEMVNAMKDSRYGRDPQYTQDVQRKTMYATFM